MNNIQDEILKDLQSASKSIKVAVSWLTDIVLINELIQSKKRGIDVKVILSCNELNIIRFELFRELIELGALVNKVGSEESEQGNFMHYKFYIIDDSIAKSGSYNWSINATTNKEALDIVPVDKKIADFEDCLEESVDFFQDIEDPVSKKAELQTIEKESKEVLTPVVLEAYRRAQATIKEQEARYRKEIEIKEKQIEKEEIAKKKAEEAAKREKEEKERILAEQQQKEKEAQYKPKEDVKVTRVPPTSYGKL
ncbi:MAG: hypothetical protein JXB49_37855 [Bacteroidales bacterium]|nr:hypothetical protein [Bacteroidales bacterium]